MVGRQSCLVVCRLTLVRWGEFDGLLLYIHSRSGLLLDGSTLVVVFSNYKIRSVTQNSTERCTVLSRFFYVSYFLYTNTLYQIVVHEIQSLLFSFSYLVFVINFFTTSSSV